jgi:uncharacterized repeat protein (TIGR03806 family)
MIRERDSCLGVAVLALIMLIAGCSREPRAPTFHAEGEPQTLAEWGVLHIDDGVLAPAAGVWAYELNTPLFSDYAEKLRTLWVPPGQSAKYSASRTFEFPVGTIVSKTFYYPRNSPIGTTETGALAARLELASVRLVETRLLVRREAGWEALSYVWDDTQRIATLRRAGEIIPLEIATSSVNGGSMQRFDYVVPDINQCAGCHATDVKRKALSPIGLAARHLNRDVDYGAAMGHANQLTAWSEAGLLTGLPQAPSLASPSAVSGTVSGTVSGAVPKAARWDDPSAELDARARAYLDINCAHCHNRAGPADTSGLSLDAAERSSVALGVCKSPIAAGRGTGDRRFGIVPGYPEESILVYRMAAVDPQVMMPELGRTLAHAEGVELISAWIAAWPGEQGCALSARRTPPAIH